MVKAMNKLIAEYRDEHGPEALQPQRKEPLTNELIVALIARSVSSLRGLSAFAAPSSPIAVAVPNVAASGSTPAVFQSYPRRRRSPGA